jgi:hypothetical protein
VHIFQADDPEIERHLAFAAYLRSHEAARQEYEALKRQVFALHPSNMIDYNNGKDAWIKRVEPIAIAWYRATNDGARHDGTLTGGTINGGAAKRGEQSENA